MTIRLFDKKEFIQICEYIDIPDTDVADAEFSIQPSDIFDAIKDELFDWLYSICIEDGNFIQDERFILSNALPNYLLDKLSQEVNNSVYYKDINTLRDVIMLVEVYRIDVDFEVSVNETIGQIFDAITDEAYSNISEYIDSFFVELSVEMQAYNDEADEKETL